MDLLYVIIILVSIIYISQTKFAKRIFSKKKCKYDPVIYMIIGFGIILGLYYVSKDIEGFQGTNQLYGKLMNDFETKKKIIMYLYYVLHAYYNDI